MSNHRHALTVLKQALDFMTDPASRAEIETEVSQALLDTMLETLKNSIIDS